MKIGANDIRVGNILEYNKRLWAVLKTMHTQPGKGGAYMQIEMKDIQDGTKNNIRFRSSETVEKVSLDQVHFQYLFDEGDNIAVMDKNNYEQRSLPKELLGDQAPFVQEGMDLAVEMYHDRAVAIVLPETVVLEVEYCEPVVKGQTATSSYKPATLTNGIRVTVPQFINQGDKVVVKVATREYMERAK